MNYKEWYEKFVEGSSEAKTAEKKLKNRSADKKQHEKYKEILGNHVPDNPDDFQEMKYIKRLYGRQRKNFKNGIFKKKISYEI